MGNSTANTTSAWQVNVSGGYIAYLNITANMQDLKWKAFVGIVSGKFALSDSNGSTIYDWSLASITGRVFSTRNSSSVNWTGIQCANKTWLEWENGQMNHTGLYDNISVTFNSTNHTSFYVGAVPIANNTCSSLATYRNSAPQSTYFQEVALTDSSSYTSGSGGKIVYSTKIEPHVTGFNNQPYDFQMIVPENGAPGYNGITPYYLYVELS